MTASQWKTALAIALLAGAAGIYLLFGVERSAVSSAPMFVCVETGEVFRIAQDKIPSVLPAKNPKTGHLTLLPAAKAEDGKIYIGKRNAWDLHNNSDLVRVNKYVDPNTLEVLKSPRS
jgi:hypothetical protein